MLPIPTLTTERLSLRKIVDTDIENVYRGFSDPETTRYYALSYPSLEATQEQMDWYASNEANGTGQFWAICGRNDGTFYGVGGLSSIDSKHRKAELSFWLLPEHCGHGYMSESVQAILHHAFSTLNLHRMEAEVETENLACIRALKKLGFDLEGTKRECEIKSGLYISLHIYAKLNAAV